MRKKIVFFSLVFVTKKFLNPKIGMFFNIFLTFLSNVLLKYLNFKDIKRKNFFSCLILKLILPLFFLKKCHILTQLQYLKFNTHPITHTQI